MVGRGALLLPLLVFEAELLAPWVVEFAARAEADADALSAPPLPLLLLLLLYAVALCAALFPLLLLAA